jgi:hypothetical protein
MYTLRRSEAKPRWQFNTFGPRMRPNDGRVISNFIVQALLGRDITLSKGMDCRLDPSATLTISSRGWYG